MNQTLENPKQSMTVAYGIGYIPEISDPQHMPSYLTRRGYRMSELAEDILGKVAFSAPRSEVGLVVVTPRELGFTVGATRQEIYAKAEQMGFLRCSAEIGPYLRLQYDFQPEAEEIIVAMDPIVTTSGYPRNFYLTKQNGLLWLRTRSGHEERKWSPDSRWIFATAETKKARA